MHWIQMMILSMLTILMHLQDNRWEKCPKHMDWVNCSTDSDRLSKLHYLSFNKKVSSLRACFRWGVLVLGSSLINSRCSIWLTVVIDREVKGAATEEFAVAIVARGMLGRRRGTFVITEGRLLWGWIWFEGGGIVSYCRKRKRVGWNSTLNIEGRTLAGQWLVFWWGVHIAAAVASSVLAKAVKVEGNILFITFFNLMRDLGLLLTPWTYVPFRSK